MARNRLPQALPVVGADDDAVVSPHPHRDALGHGVLDGVGEAQVQQQALALQLRPVAHPVDQQDLAEALVHPGDHVLDQAPVEPVHGLGKLAVVAAGH
jgi:hypothetical protein